MSAEAADEALRALGRWLVLLEEAIGALAEGVPDARWAQHAESIDGLLRALAPGALERAARTEEGGRLLQRIESLSAVFSERAGERRAELGSAVRAIDEGRRALRAYASTQRGGPYFINKGY